MDEENCASHGDMQSLHEFLGADTNANQYWWAAGNGKEAPGLALGGGGGKSAQGIIAKICGRGHSFTPETEVKLADGSTKKIEDLETGDEVLATDPETGSTENRTVLATIIGKGDKNLTELTLDTGQTTGTIIATDHHPFWSPSAHAWVNAADLNPGMTLRTDTAAVVTLRAVRDFQQKLEVRNLTIDGIHTYYVLAGNTPVLVHNSACSTFGFKDAPKVPGVYTITMKDGKVYVGSSSTNIHSRLHAAFTSDKAAVKSAGYTTSDISNISVNDMSGHSWKAIRRQEQSVIDQYGGVGGGTLLNRRNEVP
jgi:hypothetical protein